jgi:hypothetical protein
MEKELNTPQGGKKMRFASAIVGAVAALSPMLAFAANPWTTGSGAIPAGTAATMLNSFLGYTLYPVIQFVTQSEMLSIFFLLIGIALVVAFFVVVPRALIGWFKSHRR